MPVIVPRSTPIARKEGERVQADLDNPATNVGVFVTRHHVANAGRRVAIKDVLDRAGEVTTAGSRALADRPPAARSADVVERLEAAGCAIVGRANMHELAYGVTGLNAWSGTPVNPRFPHLIPGGSSSGAAAAVAGGLVEFAIGTDTGGSIRVPAACCGIVGLKPTFGRVSRRGVMPAASSLDCVGPLARDVATIDEAMAILTDRWRPHQAPETATLAFVAVQAPPAITEAARVAAAASFTLIDADLPLLAEAADAGLAVIGRENWLALGGLLAGGLLGIDVAERLRHAADITDAQLAGAEQLRTRFAAEVDALLDRVDAIALPTLPCLPPTLSEAADARAAIPITNLCRPFNLSGHPAIALPVGTVDGAPVSLQLVGRCGADEALVALARKVFLR